MNNGIPDTISMNNAPDIQEELFTEELLAQLQQDVKDLEERHKQAIEAHDRIFLMGMNVRAS